MSYDRRSGIATGRGYTGSAFRPPTFRTHPADLITDADTSLTRLPMTTHQQLGRNLALARYDLVRKSLQRTERKAEQTYRYPTNRRWPKAGGMTAMRRTKRMPWLTHAPSGTHPRTCRADFTL
jgi:hypothetical protein